MRLMFFTVGARIAVLGLLLSAAAATARAGQTEGDKNSEASKETVREAVVVEQETLPGPKYLDLRYDEDFSYLDGEPGTYQDDFFDPIKNIKLSDDLRLSIGGEFRFRLEAETNKAFDANRPTQDTFDLYRYFMHFDLKYRKTARVFLQLGVTHDEHRDLFPRGLDEDHFALQQAFFDVRPLGDGTALTLRVGRQDLNYGKERFISPLDWANARRRFDAVKLFWHDDTWNFDMFYAKPVVVSRKHFDDWNQDYDLYGAYLTYKGIADHGIDTFFFAQHNTGDPVNPNGRAGDISRYTLGSRFWGKTGNFDYDTMLAGQWGHWARDTICAWAWTLDGGYTFADYTCKPRIGVGLDRASGDRGARDGRVETFDQVFPLGHAYFGYLDLIGRQNITAANVNLTAWAVPKKVKARLAYHAFWLTDDSDALYDAGGRPTRRDPTGHSGREVGHELDLTVLWKMDRHQTLLLGYSHMWDRGFIANTGRSEDPDLLYVQYGFKF